MKKSMMTILAIFITSGLGGAAWASTPSKPSDYRSMVKSDAELTTRIQQTLLADNQIPARDWEAINVSVKNGQVTLSGRVATDAEIKRVVEAARSISGNKVTNLLESDERHEQESRGG